MSSHFSRREFLAAFSASLLATKSHEFSSIASNYPICVFSKHLHWLSIPEMAKVVANLGFDGVDLTVRKDGHIAPERVIEELPVAVSIIRKAGLDVPMMATDITNATHPLTEKILKTASNLGIKYYRMGWLDYNANKTIDETISNYKKQFKRLEILNKKYQIHGAYQNHAGTHLGASVWDLKEVLAGLDPRWIGCQFDIKHAVAEGGQSWINDLASIKSYVRCMDIKDFVWAKQANKWQHQLVPLGTGMVDYDLYLSLLKKHHIAGPMSIHYEYPLGGAESGKKQLTVSPDTVLEAVKTDLVTLQNMLQKAGLK